MKVKALRVHQNGHGDKFEKEIGDEYSLLDSEGERLVRRGLVEKIGDDDSKADRVPRARKGSGGPAKGDRKERAPKSGEEGAGADAGESGKPSASGPG